MSVNSTKKRGRPRCFDKDLALNSALHVFLEKGFEGASIEELTAALGINKPSLYAAFGNKETLFITVLEKYQEHYRTFFSELVARDLSVQETISAWLEWFLSNLQEQKTPYGCLIVNSANLCGREHKKIAEYVKQFHRESETLLGDYFIREVKKGSIQKNVDAQALSQFYNATVQGMTILYRVQQDYDAARNIANTALKILPISKGTYC